jgi:pyrroloquinoline quinone (PQQ) biosynthesis protein C
MAQTIAEPAGARTPDEFIAELEGLRAEWRKTHPFRIPEIMSPDEFPRLAEGKRRRHAGGDDNHRFEGERYLNCTDKASRRMQLRKLVDEGGQATVGGPQVSHPLLSRWESYGYGLTAEEITALEKGDSDPAELVRRGWWLAMNRDSHFAIAIGSGLVLEGEHKLRSAELLAAIEEDRKRFIEWGVPDVDRALENRHEHAGVDVDHADFNEHVVRQFVTTPELQDEMRRVFMLRLQMFSGA